jgi:hypothetical protein
MLEKVVLYTWCHPLTCREGRKVSPEDLKDLIMMVKKHKLGCDGRNDAYLCRRCFKLLVSLELQQVDMDSPFPYGGRLFELHG